MAWLRQPVLDAACVADTVEDVAPVPAVPHTRRELNAVVGGRPPAREHRVDAVGQRSDGVAQEVGGDSFVARSCNSTYTAFDVRSMATNR